MGTTWSALVAMPPAAEVESPQTGLQGELDEIVARMSPWVTTSDLSVFNASPSGSEHALPGNLFDVLDCALRVAHESNGAYDPTVGPLVDLWGFGPKPPIVQPPSTEALRSARGQVGWRRVRLNVPGRTALQPGSVSIDLCGIAKGYGVDRAAEILLALGHRHFLIEVGGELRGEGMKPDGQPWWVAIERPSGTPGPHGAGLETIVALHSLSMATSGDYRRYFEHEGVRYSHTIDPRTGRPVAHDVASVTVLHDRCMDADAWATALLVMGIEEGSSVAAKKGLAALFIRRSGEGFVEVLTPAFSEMLDQVARD